MRASEPFPPNLGERLRRGLRQTTVMTNHASGQRDDGLGAGRDAIDQADVSHLFAAALEGDPRAKTILVLLGGFDDTAHRASVALATTAHGITGPVPPDVLASTDRTLAALRDQRPQSLLTAGGNEWNGLLRRRLPS